LSCGDTKMKYVHTVHPILVSCGSGGEILFWDLSSPTVGHTTKFHNSSIIVHSRRRHFASITRRAAYARAISTGTANRKSPFARHTLKRTTQQSECLYSTRLATCSSPRETTTRPSSGRASDSPTLPRSFPRASLSAQPLTAGPNDDGDRGRRGRGRG